MSSKQKTSRSGKRAKGGGGINPGDIAETQELLTLRGAKPTEVGDVLNVSKTIADEYGVTVGEFDLATLKGRKAGSAMAYSDGTNIGFNSKYFDAAKMDTAMDNCIAAGWHPGRGNKSGIESVAAHEYGHVLTEIAGRKMGISGIDSIDQAATRIVTEARKLTSHRGVVQLARAISGYATTTNAEAVAEAFADVYCNGRNARFESRAIINTLKKYL